MPILTIFLLFTGILCENTYAGAQDDIEKFQKKIEFQQSEILKIESEIKKYKRKVLVLSEKEKKLNRELKEIELQIHNQQQILTSLKQDISEVKVEMTQLQEKLEEERKKSEKYYDLLCQTLKYYYFKQHSREVLPWFTSLFCDLGNSSYIEKMLVMLPAEKCFEIRKKIEAVTDLKLELENKRKNLVTLKQEFMGLQNNFIAQKKKQLRLLKSTKDEKENKQKKLKKIKQERKRLSKFIDSLKRNVKNLKRLQAFGEKFVSAKGKLPWPVKGEVVSNFGKQKHPQLNTFIFNRGINIKGLDSVRAIFGGEVVYSNFLEGWGNMIVIDHGNDYYTVYGNLEKLFVDVGTEVEMLDSLGSINDAIYFELGQGSKPQDPLIWLKK